MKERAPEPGVQETPVVRPSYEQLGQKLTTLFETAGGKVKEEFPRYAPKGAMSTYDPMSRTLTLHPWISPRGRVEALLHETVKRLTEKQTKKRGKKADSQPRGWAVESELARHYGLRSPESDHRDVEMTIHEQTLVDQIKGEIDG